MQAEAVVCGLGWQSLEETHMSDQPMSTYKNILVRQEGRVGLVQINRPKAMNALNSPTMAEVAAVLRAFDADDSIGCMVLSGDEHASAAGADIKQMANASVAEMLNTPFSIIGISSKPCINR